MSLHLPKPIADYIEANRRLDLDGMMKHFAPDAVFIDNGKDFVGEDAIAKMLKDEAIAVRAVFEPDSFREEDGVYVLEGPAHGDFPGSPLRFTYRFAMNGNTIRTLETIVWA
ncbi:nuclear transport factor 2 family protein [Sphingomonas sp. IC4-52]|uniref:nuclear transport factor 2 family protein n=1 Tax=Sphingomonas sp. IC4-52 TaxID=2887202 RepID=UPI001D126955|nr:nuclear transport factor 2 family protein [Sphingomonas sp. IC4-52]MCC2980262.1 nuclear transport factor 2 family protein [Sphingomonas sp. IC4-52]